MSSLARVKILLAEIEATYGTDPLPTVADNVIRALDHKPTPLAAEMKDLGYVMPYLGSTPKKPVGKHRKDEFGVHLTGSTAAGTAPAHGVLLRACGFAETLTALTDAVYNPVGTDFESVTIYSRVARQLRKLLGTRGSATLSFAAGDYPRINFAMIGLWSAATDGAPPSVSAYPNSAPPLEVTKDNTTFTIFGHAVPLKSLEIQLGVEAKLKDRPNQKGIFIGNRQVAGTISFEWPDLTTWDVEADAAAGTTGVLALVHGTTAGNIVRIDAPVVQISDPKFEEEDGIMMCSASITLIPDAGNDELIITVK